MNLYSFCPSYHDYCPKGTKIDTENECHLEQVRTEELDYSMSLPKLLQQKLIYNISWEDYDLDIKLLRMDSNSRLLTIASAGDHLLNYLPTDVSFIHGVDINPAQIALVELKQMLLKHMDYQAWWELFGEGSSAKTLQYIDHLKPYLSYSSYAYWKKNGHFFSVAGPGFYRYGSSGYLSRIILKSIQISKLETQIFALIEEDNDANKEALFTDFWKQLSRHWVFKLWLHPWLQYLGGIPTSQQQRKTTLVKLLRNVFHHIFVKSDFETNPFWNLYLYGKYQAPYIPWHLSEDGFNSIKKRINRLSISHHSMLESRRSHEQYTHINLLDHQDWYKGIDDIRLQQTWDWLNRSESIKTILFRTIHPEIPWISLINQGKFDIRRYSLADLTEDRVATYPSTYVLHTNQ